MSDAAWNLMMADKYPNWYDHLDKVHAAVAEQDRVYEARSKAGWELDEDGWYTPDGTHECEYDGPLPEDNGTS
jgi:hypothetical protein